MSLLSGRECWVEITAKDKTALDLAKEIKTNSKLFTAINTSKKREEVKSLGAICTLSFCLFIPPFSLFLNIYLRVLVHFQYNFVIVTAESTVHVSVFCQGALAFWNTSFMEWMSPSGQLYPAHTLPHCAYSGFDSKDSCSHCFSERPRGRQFLPSLDLPLSMKMAGAYHRSPLASSTLCETFCFISKRTSVLLGKRVSSVIGIVCLEVWFLAKSTKIKTIVAQSPSVSLQV